MTALGALLEMLARVETSQGAGVLVSEEELSRWPTLAVKALKFHNLLVRASPATTVVCPGCEQDCAMLVQTVSAGIGKAASFVVCDKRDDTIRVPISAERIRQWRCGVEAVARFVAQGLGLRPESRRKTGDGLWELGLAKGKKRSQMLCLRANGPLELVAGNNSVPLAQVVRSREGGYLLDDASIQHLVDSATTGDSRYTPSDTLREARKLKTQALHDSWRKAYQALKRSRPGMSGVWYSRQIAKMETGKERNAETIRKHMNQ